MKTFAALAVSALAVLGAVPAVARPATGYYTATPKAAFDKPTLVTRSTLWRCADGLCIAGKGAERDSVLCELVVQKVGALTSFTVGGAALAEDDLAKCNARAR